MRPTADPFWEAFGLPTCPDFSGKSVLELGCGHGWRCIQAAEHGAALTVGLDPLEAQIAEARATLAKSSIKTPETVRFVQSTIEQLPPDQFDVIISESSLEHVINVPSLLAEARKRLKIGGRFYLGFGPLYHSFEGDHGWLRQVLPFRRFFAWPWGHLLLEKFAMRRLEKLHGAHFSGTCDWPYLDLNQHTLEEYERMFKESGMRIAYVRTNHVRSLKSRLLALAAKVPGLSKYCTVNMYIVFER